jgi:hypothetical protein
MPKKTSSKPKNRCWKGYEPTPGKKAYSDGSCQKAKKSKKSNKK